MLPKKFWLTVEAMLYIAIHSGGRPINGKEVCKYIGVQPRYLEPVFQSVSQKSMLRGSRGPKGGYVLAREKRKILLSDIFLAIEEIEKDKEPSQDVSEIHLTTINVLKQATNKHMLRLLEGISLEDLHQSFVDKVPLDLGADFSI